MDKAWYSLIAGRRNKRVRTNIRVLSSFAVAVFYLVISNGCSEQAQEAAEKANRDTVPVIETQRDKDTASSATDSLKRE